MSRSFRSVLRRPNKALNPTSTSPAIEVCLYCPRFSRRACRRGLAGSFGEERRNVCLRPRCFTVSSCRCISRTIGIIVLTFTRSTKATNGEVGIFDCAHLLTFGVFREFEDIHYFKRARVLQGTVVWPHEQDICPDTLYEDSLKVAPVSAAPGQ